MASRSAILRSNTWLLHRFAAREVGRRVVPSAISSTQPIPTTLDNPPTVDNPFIPTLNPITKRWAPPIYSLRRQKELIKKAREDGVEDKLPLGRKSITTSSKLIFGRQRGYDLGGSTIPEIGAIRWKGEPKALQKEKGERKVKFKGHIWEREAPMKKEMVESKMKEMQARITKWKKRRKGRTAGKKMPF